MKSGQVTAKRCRLCKGTARFKRLDAAKLDIMRELLGEVTRKKITCA